jgi:hypothetical protein
MKILLASLLILMGTVSYGAENKPQPKDPAPIGQGADDDFWWTIWMIDVTKPVAPPIVIC